VNRRGNEFDWLAELDGSERDTVDGWDRLSESERLRIERLDVEVLGQLPETLDPVEPSPGVKAELMAQIAAPVVTPFPISARSAPPRWLLPLAATVAVVAIGAAVWMAGTVREQQAQLTELQGQIEGYAALETSLSAARENLSLVSSRGVEVCPLRPVSGTTGDERGPFGLLFVASDHQHWYVRVAGLEAQPDRYYRVWFETEDGMVPAGDLLGQELELGAPTMPEGTRAIHVSVETTPNAETPSGELVLFGNDMVRVS